MNIVQVVGGPGSGKTTLAQKLVEDWPGSASLMRIDRYLRNRRSDDGENFWLLPTSIDWPLVLAHLDLLRAGGQVTMPSYDWERGQRLITRPPAPPEQIVEASEWLIIEGLYYVPQVDTVRLFVDVSVEVRSERSSALATQLSQSLREIHGQVVETAYVQHILPQRKLADHVLDGSLDQVKLADRARRFLASYWTTGW